MSKIALDFSFENIKYSQLESMQIQSILFLYQDLMENGFQNFLGRPADKKRLD